MSGPRISTGVVQKVGFGAEIIDLAEKEDPISLESFQVLMEEEEEEEKDNRKPYFLFAFVHSSKHDHSFKHLYSAENIIHWYPLEGTTDPCTGEEIEKIEYYFYVKGQKTAIHMGDVVHESPPKKEKQNKMGGSDSFTKDFLIWSITAEDEPSRMMSLLVIAYLYSFGLCRNIKSTERLDTSQLLRLSGIYYSERQHHQSKQPNRERRNQEEHHKISNLLYKYIVNRISNHIRISKLTCSDINALLSSMKHDAAKIVAETLVRLDPTIKEDNPFQASLILGSTHLLRPYRNNLLKLEEPY